MSEPALSAFNAAIKDVQLEPLDNELPKMLFICGAPRSGTTIMAQSLCYVGKVGYINNLVARFVSNPELGVLYSSALNMNKYFSGHSNYGSTDHPTEPHEFGQGWQRLLDVSSVEEPLSLIHI